MADTAENATAARPKPVRLQSPVAIMIDGVRYPATAFLQFENGNMTGAGHHLYVMTHGNGKTARSKIGITTNLDSRLANVNASSPVAIRLAKAWTVPDYTVKWAEKAAHDILRHKHSHNEWFICDQHLAVRAVSLVLPHVTSLKYLWELRKSDPEYCDEIVRLFKEEQAIIRAEDADAFIRPCNRHPQRSPEQVPKRVSRGSCNVRRSP